MDLIGVFLRGRLLSSSSFVSGEERFLHRLSLGQKCSSYFVCLCEWRPITRDPHFASKIGHRQKWTLVQQFPNDKEHRTDVMGGRGESTPYIWADIGSFLENFYFRRKRKAWATFGNIYLAEVLGFQFWFQFLFLGMKIPTFRRKSLQKM